MNRRHFLMASAAALPRRMSASPNDRIRIACVGVRGQGKEHIKAYAALPNVEVAAVCDVDESVLEARLADAEALGQKRPEGYVDFRKLLEDKSIDAVSLATPNHWHALQAIWACQAGKHVYLEKPCAHTIFEARQVVAAARKYDRIVQHGTQSRSSPAIQEGIQQLRDGLIGDVYMARGLCFKWRDTIGRTPDEAVPPGVHYDLWLGPAPKRPFSRNRFHYNWHWQWAYGNGDIGNQGPHQMDNARWGLGVRYPTKVSCIGGHFMFDDDQETPNTQTATFEFQSAGRKKLLVFEVRHWITNHEAEIGVGHDPGSIGNVFYGSEGLLTMEWMWKYASFLGKEKRPGPSREAEPNHFANFIQALRSGNRSDLTAEVEEGAISVTLVHLANISYRLGRSLNFDADALTCPGDDEATRMFTKEYRKPFQVPDHV